MSNPFTGSDFKLQSVTQIAGAVIRARFTYDPLAASPSGANDALNIAQYTATGPAANAITSAGNVPDDPQAIDITFAAPLAIGTWNLAASSNIQTAGGRPLQPPLALSFEVTFLSELEPVSAGAQNDSAESVIRKHLGSAFKGKAWNALIAALAVSDRLNWDNARLAFDQLFKSTASGIYLDRKAGDDGLARPHALGMPDELFRKLAVTVTSNKLTQEVLLEILEIFYGPDSVRAHVDTELAEPFRLADGDDLAIVVDERETITTIFRAEDANQITQARAREVAATITRAFRANGNKSYAVTFVDTITGKSKVRIYSSSLGLASSLRITGGRAQKGLQFETRIVTPISTTNPATVNWTVTVPEAGRARYTITGATAVNMSLVQAGDYLLVTGATFLPENRGSFKVEDVSVRYSGATLTQYIEVLNPAVLAQGSLSEQALDDVLFFRPIKKTIHVGTSRTVVVAQNRPAELDIVIPATTQAVGRTVGSGAYAKLAAALHVTSLKRDKDGVVTVVTSDDLAALGLVAGRHVLVDEAWGGTTGPTFQAGSEFSGESDSSLASIWSSLRPQLQQGAIWHTATLLQDQKVLIVGGASDTSFSGFIIPQINCEQFGITGSTTLPGGEVQYTYDWYPASSTIYAHAYHGATLLNDGRVFVSMGWDGNDPLSVTELFTPDGGTGSWAAGPSGSIARGMVSASLLTDGTVLVAGGAKTIFEATEIAEIYTPGSPGAIAATGSMNDARAEAEIVSLPSNKALVIGGRAMARGHVLDDWTLALWRLDESSPGADADIGPNGFTLSDSGSVVVTGKIGNGRTVSTGQFMYRLGPEPVLAAALVLEWTMEAWTNCPFASPGGTIISFGNNTETSVDNRLMDISIGATDITWTWENGSGVDVTGSVAHGLTFDQKLWNHVAVVKQKNAVTPTNYDVLVYVNGVLKQTFSNQTNSDGGANSNLYVGTSLEAPIGGNLKVDDIRLSTRARTAGEIQESYGRGAAGAMQIMQDPQHPLGQLLATCEVFSAGTWTRSGSMSWARAGHKAVALPDGRVLVTGGVGYPANELPPLTLSGYQYITDAEIWDPITGRWSVAGRMSTGRAWHTATLLPARNQVLVRGGSLATNPYSELLDITTMTWRRSPIATTYTVPMDQKYSRAVLMPQGVVFVNGGYGNFVNLQSLLYIPASDFLSLGGMTGQFPVASVSLPSTFTYRTFNFQGLTTNQNSSVAIYPVAAETAGPILGPYVFDPAAGVAVTAVETTIAQDLFKGRQYTTLNVADATEFPDEEGWLVIGFGTSSSVAPVRYLGRYSTTALILDYQFKFPVTNLSGASVTLLAQKGFFNPDNPEEIGSFYLTASSAGRVAAQQQLDSATAAGIKVNTTIVYPGDRGLGGEGLGVTGARISDKVAVWGGDSLDAELGVAHGDG